MLPNFDDTTHGAYVLGQGKLTDLHISQYHQHCSEYKRTMESILTHPHRREVAAL